MHQGTRLPSALHKVEKSVVTALQGKLGTRSARFAEGQFHTTVFPSLRPASRREVSELDDVLSRLLAEHSADYGGDEGGEDARPECLSGKSDGGGDGHPPRNSAWGTPRNGCNDGSGRVAGPRSGDEEESGVGEESTSLPEGFEDVTKLLDLSQEEEHVYDMCFHECIRQVRTRYVRVGVALCRAGWVACMSRRTCLAQCLLGERDERGHLTVQQYTVSDEANNRRRTTAERGGAGSVGLFCYILASTICRGDMRRSYDVLRSSLKLMAPTAFLEQPW